MWNMGKDDLLAKIFFGTIIGVPLLIYVDIAYDAFIVQNRFEDSYERALQRHADADQNGVITTPEKEAFDADWLGRNDATLRPGEERPRHRNTGIEVSWNMLLEWIEDYR